jgi:putative membrane protein
LILESLILESLILESRIVESRILESLNPRRRAARSVQVTHFARVLGDVRKGAHQRRTEMKRYGFLSIALAAAVTLGCNSNARHDASATNPPAGGAVGTAGSGESTVSNGDKDFVKDLAIANTAEIELGRLAVERGANPEVKKFGQMMIDDHTKANDDLTSVASQHSIPVVNELDDQHRDLRDKLSKLQGMDFDREYIDAMVDGHEKVLDKLGSRVDKDTLDKWKARATDASGNKVKTEVEAVTILPEKSDNPVTMSINEWAAKAYPVVSGHLDAAKTLKDTLKKRSTN